MTQYIKNLKVGKETKIVCQFICSLTRWNKYFKYLQAFQNKGSRSYQKRCLNLIGPVYHAGRLDKTYIKVLISNYKTRGLD